MVCFMITLLLNGFSGKIEFNINFYELNFNWTLGNQEHADFEEVYVPADITATRKLPVGDWT